MKLQKIIGLKVAAIKGYRTDMRRKKGFSPEYILFDDQETIIELEDQDYHTYHDCDSLARRIIVKKDKALWEYMMTDENHYPNADKDLEW
jgi:hypothetical protein